MTKINKILETALYVKNIDKAEQFYNEVFGFQTYSKSGNRHVFFKIGESMLLLFNAQETIKDGSVPTHGMQGQGHIAFAIEHHELEIWRKRLQIKNVQIEREITWLSGGKSIYFRDIDGNSLELATPDTWP